MLIRLTTSPFYFIFGLMLNKSLAGLEVSGVLRKKGVRWTSNLIFFVKVDVDIYLNLKIK